MQVTDLQIGQNATILYWFRTRSGDDCSTISGVVTEKCGDRVEIHVQDSFPAWFNSRKVWVSNRSEVIKIIN